MNKYKEAYEVIDTILHLMCGEENESGFNPTHDEMVDSMKVFEELVKKATPKKPINLTRAGYIREAYDAYDVYEGICPNCGNQIDSYESEQLCVFCDQRIDWSEEE